MKASDGQRHSAKFKAKSVFDAAAQMHSRLTQIRYGHTPTELPPETVFEVRPVYRVKKEAVVKWITIQAAKSIRINVRHER